MLLAFAPSRGSRHTTAPALRGITQSGREGDKHLTCRKHKAAGRSPSYQGETRVMCFIIARQRDKLVVIRPGHGSRMAVTNWAHRCYLTACCGDFQAFQFLCYHISSFTMVGSHLVVWEYSPHQRLNAVPLGTLWAMLLVCHPGTAATTREARV